MNTEQIINNNIVNLCYVIAAIFFIIGLKRLSSPGTAKNGNRLASIGMLIAVLATVLGNNILGWEWIISSILIASIIGVFSARKIQMTAMPQLVAIFNGLGGSACGLIAAGELYNLIEANSEIAKDTTITIMISTIIGSLTLTGSLIAFGKLQEIMPTRPILLPARNILNIMLILALIFSAIWLVIEPSYTPFIIAAIIALILGILIVIPILISSF